MTALEFYKERLKNRGFSEKQIKDLTDHKDLPWLQFAEDYHQKQLRIGGVVRSCYDCQNMIGTSDEYGYTYIECKSFNKNLNLVVDKEDEAKDCLNFIED